MAVLVSNESLTAIEWFKFNFASSKNYNDVVRMMYDELYKMNIGCDFVHPASENLEDYTLLVVPALYTASDSLLERLNEFVKNGGHIVYSFKSGFTDENVKVRTTRQPGMISEACGITYSMFVEPKNVSLKGNPFEVGAEDNYIETWMELITPTTAEVLAYYDHPHWGQYAAITQNHYGKGIATYIGCMTSPAIMKGIGACCETSRSLGSRPESGVSADYEVRHQSIRQGGSLLFQLLGLPSLLRVPT
ncbi:beta-galactosidase [Ectobacillus funiculus]